MKKSLQEVKLPKFVEDRPRRMNMKCKRRKNILKKGMELQSMCGLEVLIIIKDPEFNKI